MISLKNKNATYLLGLLVVMVWGIVAYRIFIALTSNEDVTPVVNQALPKKSFDDYAIPCDTSNLLLNYRDPFGLVRQKDTSVIAVKHFKTKVSLAVIPKPAFNWNFIRYAGYVRNPGSKKLISVLIINGQSAMLAEGESKDQVKLLKNMRDSVKISYQGKKKYVTQKTGTP